MSHPAFYRVGDERLSAEQCRALFSRMPLLDRQLKVIERIEGETIVDIGCHSGLFVREVARRFPERTVIGIDCFEDNILIAQLLYPEMRDCFRKMSVYSLDMADATVDCITLQEVIEHLEGAAAAIKEVNRALKPGGVLIVTVPNPFYLLRIAQFVFLEIGNALRRWRGRSPRLDAEVLSKSMEWDRHIYSWTPQTLLTLLVTNGFEYVEHCYECRTPDLLRRCLLAVLPFLGPTQILKVRKVKPAPPHIV